MFPGNAAKLVNPNTARIVVLTAGGPFAEAIINVLVRRFDAITVVQEQPERRGEILRRWRRLRGMRRMLGQLAFGPLQRLAAYGARGRRRAILAAAELDTAPNLQVARVHVENVNSRVCQDALVAADPRVILVIGTRMIRAATLACVEVPFINYHAGLNPMYRGQYGGYWALARGDRDHFGVTVHLVDAGVDTGATLYTARATPTAADTVASYHYVQLVAAIPLIECAVDDALNGRLVPQRTDGVSKQWFHPTAAEYLANGLRRGVW